MAIRERRSTVQSSARPIRAAFTFVEIVIVILVMGIMAAVTAPTFYQSLCYNRLESAARRLKLDLDQVRRTAQLKSRSESITFSGSTYTLSSGVAALDHAGQSYVVDLSASPFELESVVANFGGLPAALSVSFDGYGTASRSGTIVLSLNGHQRTITLTASTGNITVSGN